MYARSGTDPWAGWQRHVDDVDLVKFFGWVRDNNVDFFATTVEAVASQVRAAGGRRSNTAKYLMAQVKTSRYLS